MQDGFVYLDDAVDGLLWDAKYSGNDNFTGAVVDGYLANRVVGTCELASALNEAQTEALMHGARLLVWDAYRPKRAVASFLQWVDAPENGETKQKHYPRIDKSDMVVLGYIADISGHSRGSSVDLTLVSCDTMRLFDMGGDFDYMDESSHHEAKGISNATLNNRRLLRAIMEKCGFKAYTNEWWHYTLINEPYPDTYFNFSIQ